MQPTRQKRDFHPSGDDHWTRQPGVKREPWGKLKPTQIDALCARYQAGETPTNLSAFYGIARPTVYRYLRARGLLRTAGA
jgi:hypothetical protein